MKTRVLLLLCRFWRTKQLVIFHKLIVIKIKKINQYIGSTRHILTIDLFQNNQYQVDRYPHQTNDPVCFPRCRQHAVCHIYVCCICPCTSCACFPVTTLIFVSGISCHSTYQHGRIPVEYGQKGRDHQDTWRT